MMNYWNTIIGLFYFAVLIRLELIVKDYTIKMFSKNTKEIRQIRLRLFLFIISIVLFPPIISLVGIINQSYSPNSLTSSLTVYSGVFGLYFCVCKLISKKYIYKNWIITVPSPSKSTKLISLFGGMTILTLGCLYFIIFLN